MSIKHIYPIILIATAPFGLWGQTLADLRKNPDVSWASEVEHDWVLDISSPEDSLWGHNPALVLAWNHPPGMGITFPNEFARGTILAAIKNHHLTVYRDRACTQPINWEDLAKTDTGFSSCNNQAVIIRQPRTVEELLYFQVHQIIYYDTKKACFNSTPPTVGLIFKETDNEGNIIVATQPLCWFKAQSSLPHSVKKPTFVIRTWSKSARNLLDLQSAKPLKTPKPETEPRTHLWRLLTSSRLDQRKLQFYNWQNFPERTALTLDEQRKIVSWRDTIETYDPYTQQSGFVIEQNQIMPEEVKEFRLVQKWIWDDRKKQLFVCLEGFAPLLDIKDSEGVFRYKKPLFYRFKD